MAYGNTNNVKKLLTKVNLGASTKLNAEDIRIYIERVDAGVINSRLATEYVIPITGTQSLKIVAAISEALAAKEIYLALSGSRGEMPAFFQDLNDTYYQTLKDLANPKNEYCLPDAPRRQSNVNEFLGRESDEALTEQWQKDRMFNHDDEH